MDPTTAFAELLSRPEAEVEVERMALLIAAHARCDLDVEAELALIDRLAEGCDADDLGAVLRHLFGQLGFRGNARAYYDPSNSYLDRVVATRKGIPITLSVLTVAVARRRGVGLVGVGMPGHFLVRSLVEPVYVDPFGGGTLLDHRGVEALFQALHGPDARLDPAMLEPVGPRTVATRMLNNLVGVFAARRDAQGRLWALRLRAMVPGATLEERAEVASGLAAVGHFDDAARWLEALSFEAPDPVASAYRASAERVRSRLN